MCLTNETIWFSGKYFNDGRLLQLDAKRRLLYVHFSNKLPHSYIYKYILVSTAQLCTEKFFQFVLNYLHAFKYTRLVFFFLLL